MNDRSALLLYDGTCGFCAQSVQFVLRHERQRRTLRFAALQSEPGTAVRERHPELDRVDSVIWLEPGDGPQNERVYVRSAAVLRVLRYLGGVWTALAWLGGLVPSVVRDALYDFIARNRQKLVRGGASCLLPTIEQRARFVDLQAAD
jgi:predicted DCC family thiol-disulfide oxidoreductase YuxK